jgi:type IX secretion system PorP/SprF family membrane protein
MPTLGLNAGMAYQYEDLLKRLYAGVSVYHLNRPRQTALADSTNRVPQRFTLHGGGVFLSGEALRLTVHALYQRQARAEEFAFGGAVGYDVGMEHTFFAGAWYRMGDAVYPYLSYVRNGMQIGLTYDVQVSSMRQAVPRNGSIELSFLYTRPDDRSDRRAMPWNY